MQSYTEKKKNPHKCDSTSDDLGRALGVLHPPVRRSRDRGSEVAGRQQEILHEGDEGPPARDWPHLHSSPAQWVLSEASGRSFER